MALTTVRTAGPPVLCDSGSVSIAANTASNVQELEATLVADEGIRLPSAVSGRAGTRYPWNDYRLEQLGRPIEYS